MTTSAILLVLLSAAIHVGWNYLTKSSGDPAVFSLLKGTTMAAVAVAGLAMLPLSTLPAALWSFVLISGLLHGIYILALSKAYESGDISYVYPIARSAPALVPVAAFLIIGETISMRGGAPASLSWFCVYWHFSSEGTVGLSFWISSVRSLKRSLFGHLSRWAPSFPIRW